MTAVDVFVPAGASPAPAGPIPLRRPLTGVVIVVAIASLPLLRPAGPGNTGFADVGLVGAALIAALWVSGRSHRMHFPYAWPTALTIGAGALAAIGAGGNSLALVQDVFIFSWALAVANLARDAGLLDVLMKAWAYSGVAWGCLMIVGVVAGMPWLSGTTARDGTRAALTLGDPNLAANYFLCTLFVLRACQRPRKRIPRIICCAVIIVALSLTLSNGGFLALVVATQLGWIFGLARRRGLAPALLVSGVLVVATAIAVASINFAAVADKAQQSTPLLRDSIGRQGESSSSRVDLVRTEMYLWLHDNTLIGIGPQQTEHRLRSSNASYVKEAHNDYLAALVERGVLGAFAIIMLGCAVAVRCRRIAKAGALPAAYAAIVPRPELLGALAVAVAGSAMLYETLHFRHVWALFGLIAALEIATRNKVSDR